MWTYKGVDIYPADPNCTGIRWYARMSGGSPAVPPVLRADTKDSMRKLITHYKGQGQ